jgi:hypothetical protein
MNKIVCLVGAGAVQGEMTFEGIEADITMAGISENVLRMSKENDGPYFRLLEEFGIPPDQDIELMMSLFEGFADRTNKQFDEINKELRKLFRRYLTTHIPGRIKTPRLMTSLLHIYVKYPQFMGEGGEKLLGILTTNYDSLLEEASCQVYRSINTGFQFKSKDYKMSMAIPPVLKLHGSFNWKAGKSILEISKSFEKAEDNQTEWIPPSVYKKPPEILQKIWKQASKLLVNCDILRIIGSSLRNEDWSLISLIFTSQVMSKRVFDIELIVPQKSATDEDSGRGIMERLRFLGKLKPPSTLPIFKEGIDNTNVFFSWLINKVTEIHDKTTAIDEDKLIKELLDRGM